MRITKEKAAEVAKKLAKKKHDEWESCKLELSNFVKGIALSKIPVSVIDMNSEYPDYIKKETFVKISGEGIDNYDLRNHYFDDEIITDKKIIEVTKKQSDKIQKLKQKSQGLYSEWKQLKKEIETAVYNLRTYKRVQTEFPEAFELLPKQNISTALSVNLTDIRNKLK